MTNPFGEFALKSPDDKDWEAYVGLREEAGKVTLRVPHGYPSNVAEADKPRILGELMRVVARFSEAFSNKVDRSTYNRRSTRDGWLNASGGQSFGFDSNGAAPGYTHLSHYVQLIRKLCDPHLMTITKTLGLTSQFDHRHIGRNLERAMFLPDGTPVFEHSWAPRTQMRHIGNDMVELACWMALDGLKKLFPDSAGHEVGFALQSEWEGLTHRFSVEHELDGDASLFSGKRAETLPLLQVVLETCVRLAPPASFDARELHHLLDELLHYSLSRQDGDIWGLKGFNHVWESACLEYAIKQYGADKIFTCDDEFLLGIDLSIREKWKRNRHKVFANNGIARRPDLIVENGDGTYLIIDFKYYAADEARNKFTEAPHPPGLELLQKNREEFSRKWKPYQDIASVEAYRWRLMQYELESNDASKVEIELWVPDMEESYCQCHWMDGLTLVSKSAREILGDYAKKFRLMD